MINHKAIIEETPFLWRVEDTETGNYVIYIGSEKELAIESILEDDEPELWDLYCDGERVWCGKVDTIAELKSL